MLEYLLLIKKENHLAPHLKAHTNSPPIPAYARCHINIYGRAILT